MPRKHTTTYETLRKQRAFLAAFALCPEGRQAVAIAAAAAGVHRATPYRWRASNVLFRQRWEAVAAAHAEQVAARVAELLAERQAARERRLAELRPVYQANAAAARAAKRHR